MIGFRQYRFLPSATRVVDFVPDVSESRKDSDDIMDLVFACDPVTGFPASSIGRYLSDNVSDEVRNFIEQKIMVDLPQDSTNMPDNVVRQLRNLDPDFQSACVRKRFESLDEYSARISSYIDRLNNESKSNKAYKEFIEWSKKRVRD